MIECAGGRLVIVPHALPTVLGPPGLKTLEGVSGGSRVCEVGGSSSFLRHDRGGFARPATCPRPGSERTDPSSTPHQQAG